MEITSNTVRATVTLCPPDSGHWAEFVAERNEAFTQQLTNAVAFIRKETGAWPALKSNISVALPGTGLVIWEVQSVDYEYYSDETGEEMDMTFYFDFIG